MKFECTGHEHIHVHTDHSLLDGFQTVSEVSKRVKELGCRFVTISDHGTMSAVPQQIKYCDKEKLSPIFAIEFYCNPLQPELKEGETSADYAKMFSPQDKPSFRKSYHLLGIAYNNVGYTNLVKLSSLAWTKGFYYRPRINHEQLMKYKEGIIFTSCCYNSEIGQAFDKHGEDAAFQMIEKYIGMFGDKFYLEIMLLDFKKQKPYNVFIIKAAEKYNLKIILTNDCHVCNKEDIRMQQLMLMVQKKSTLKDIQAKLEVDGEADVFEIQDKNLWMKSEEELNEKWESDYSDTIDYEVFKQAKRNTVTLCEMAKGVQLDRSIKLLVFESADERLFDAIKEGFLKLGLPKTKLYQDRIKEEYELITQKGFSSYFLIQKMMTDAARKIGPEILGYGDGSEVIGVGRGSVVGSLVAYCIGIIGIDPVKHDLLFSRFLSPARGGKTMKIRFASDPIQMMEKTLDFKLTGKEFHE